MRGQYRYLLFEFMRQPNIIGVQKGDVLTFGVTYAQVARSSSASILVVHVLQIAYLTGMLFSIPQGKFEAPIG